MKTTTYMCKIESRLEMYMLIIRSLITQGINEHIPITQYPKFQSTINKAKNLKLILEACLINTDNYRLLDNFDYFEITHPVPE